MQINLEILCLRALRRTCFTACRPILLVKKHLERWPAPRYWYRLPGSAICSEPRHHSLGARLVQECGCTYRHYRISYSSSVLVRMADHINCLNN